MMSVSIPWLWSLRPTGTPNSVRSVSIARRFISESGAG